MANFVDDVLAHMRQFSRLRGAVTTTNKKTVPFTTWGDIVGWTAAFDKAVQGAVHDLNTWGTVPDAYREWQSTTPFEMAAVMFPGAPVFELAKFIAGNQSIGYPFNVEFWNATMKLAIALNAAGSVPPKWEYSKEAISEAFDELPERVRGTMKDIINGTASLIPSELWWIGGGLLALSVLSMFRR